MTDWYPFAMGLACVVSFWAGWKARSKYTPPAERKPWERRGKRKLETAVSDFLSVSDTHQIKFLNIDGPRALAICSRIAGGKTMSHRNTAGVNKKWRGKDNGNRILTRTQFEKLREQMIGNGYGYINRRGSLTPTPLGVIIAKSVIARERAARLHTTKQVRK